MPADRDGSAPAWPTVGEHDGGKILVGARRFELLTSPKIPYFVDIFWNNFVKMAGSTIQTTIQLPYADAQMTARTRKNVDLFDHVTKTPRGEYKYTRRVPKDLVEVLAHTVWDYSLWSDIVVSHPELSRLGA